MAPYMPALYCWLFRCLPRERMFTETQGSFWLDFRNPFFFLWSQIQNSCPKTFTRTTAQLLHPAYASAVLIRTQLFSLGFIDRELLSLNHTPQRWKLFHSNYAGSNCKTPMPFSLEVPRVSYKRFFSNWTVCRRGNLHAPVARSWPTTASGKSAQLFSSLSLSASLENTEQSCGLTSNHILFFL